MLFCPDNNLKLASCHPLYLLKRCLLGCLPPRYKISVNLTYNLGKTSFPDAISKCRQNSFDSENVARFYFCQTNNVTPMTMKPKPSKRISGTGSFKIKQPSKTEKI